MTGLLYIVEEVGRTLWKEARKRPYLGGAVGCTVALFTVRILFAVASVLFADTPTRFPLAGEISMDGQPLESGVVSFENVADGRSKAVAYVQEGRFVLPGKPGLNAGTYKVRITQPTVDYSAWVPVREPPKKAGSATPQRAALGSNAGPVPLVVPPSIPARYNTQTELAVTVGRWGTRKVRWNLSTSP